MKNNETKTKKETVRQASFTAAHIRKIGENKELAEAVAQAIEANEEGRHGALLFTIAEAVLKQVKLSI